MPLQMPADEYRLIADLVNRLGEPYVGGILLKSTLKTVILTCDKCGTVEPPTQRGWLEDWLGICHKAMDHVKENPGHSVAVKMEQYAIYTGHGAE